MDVIKILDKKFLVCSVYESNRQNKGFVELESIRQIRVENIIIGVTGTVCQVSRWTVKL